MTTFQQQVDKAWKIISPVGRTTASYLQLQMSIGYMRASKIIGELVKREILRPPVDLKSNKVLKKYLSNHKKEPYAI